MSGYQVHLLQETQKQLVLLQARFKNMSYLGEVEFEHIQ